MLRKTYVIENAATLRYNQDSIHIITQNGADYCRALDDADSIIIDHSQVTISTPLLQALADRQIDLVICDEKHIPCGIYLPLHGHTMMGYRTRLQAEAPKPLCKNLWKVTIQSKINNQALALKAYGMESSYLSRLQNKVKSGDSKNTEAMAAAYYWKHFFLDEDNNDNPFTREPSGLPPNNLLNFGYAVLRSMCARYLIAAGLWPIYGIHHHNRYNSFPLADDIMEPYRPMVDIMVKQIWQNYPSIESISSEIKSELLSIHTMDVLQDGFRRPLQVSMQHTCSSLAKAFETKNISDLKYPTLIL